jgi:hypothetical protein
MAKPDSPDDIIASGTVAIPSILSHVTSCHRPKCVIGFVALCPGAHSVVIAA